MGEAVYFGLDDLATLLCRSTVGLVWFNVRGMRIPVDKKFMAWTFDLLRNEDKEMPFPRDDGGALVFDRDPQLFSDIRHYIGTNVYPNWIDKR
jgi:hypothetical protein